MMNDFRFGFFTQTMTRMIHPENPHCATMRSSQTEGADQACPTDQILSSPRIEALGNRLIYLLKVVRVEATPCTLSRQKASIRLGVLLDADFPPKASRNEDEISDRESETHRPPDGGEEQGVPPRSEGVCGQ